MLMSISIHILQIDQVLESSIAINTHWKGCLTEIVKLR